MKAANTLEAFVAQLQSGQPIDFSPELRELARQAVEREKLRPPLMADEMEKAFLDWITFEEFGGP